MYKPLARPAVLKYFTTESQEKPRAIFEKVHFPIDKIRVEFCQEGRHGEFAHESQVAKWVLDVDGTAWRNRIFSVVGETGSGKSELCQYLQYEASHSSHHVPILISRSTTKLAQIIRMLNEHAGIQDEAPIDELTELSEAHIVSQSVAYVMRVTLTLQFKNRYSDSQLRELERLFQRDAFKALLARSFEEYRAQVVADGKERQLNLLNRKEFDLLFGNALPWLHLDSAYMACRNQIHEGIKGLVQVGDMGGRLKRIAERYRALKKRPLLIMEDLTSFGFMKEELLDFLFELNTGNFDVVMGWTTGFEAENLGSIFRTEGDGYTYMRERLRGRFAMTDAQRTSWFLEQHHVAMMTRYIQAAGTESGRVYGPGDLYPVNAAFVTNVYNRLIDDDKQPKKTPRLLLRTMQAILARPDEPWLMANDLVGQMLAPKALPDKLFSMEADYPDAVRFLEWYGDPVGGKVTRRLARELGVELPEVLADFLTDDDLAAAKPEIGERSEATIDSDADSDANSEVDTAPKSVTASKDTGTEPHSGVGTELKPGGGIEPKAGAGTEPKPVKPAEKVDPLEKEKLDVQQWLQGGDFTLRRMAEKGLGALLGVYGDVSGIGNPRSNVTPVLTFEKQTKVHVVFEGTRDKVEPFPQVIVKRDRRTHAHILTALTTGQNSRMAETARAAFLQDPELVQWVSQLYDGYRKAEWDYLTKRLAMPVEQFVYHLYMTVVGLTTGEYGDDIRSLVTFDPSVKPGAPELLCLKDAPEVKELLRYRRTVTNLFRSFFFLNPTTLDLPLLLKAREGYSYDAFGKKVAAVARDGIDQGFWLTVDSAEARAKDEKVLLSHLFTQCVSLDGRLKSARLEFAVDRQRMQQEEIRSLAAGLDEDEFRIAVRRIDALLAATKRSKQKDDWDELVNQEPLDLARAAAALEAVAQAANAATDVFAMVAAHRAHEAQREVREVKVLGILHRLLTQMDEDVRQMEAEVSDKQFNLRSGGAISECRKHYDQLTFLVQEVGA